MLTQERLKSLLDYCPETGVFRWRKKIKKVNAGDVAGSLQKLGYWTIQVDGKTRKAHRLAWLYVYGEMPMGMLDHIDGSKTNNRIANLREVTCRQNHQNRECHRRGHLPGTQRDKNRFKATAWWNGRTNYIGMFKTQPEAHEAYMNFLRSVGEA